jgi:hypothetical protein
MGPPPNRGPVAQVGESDKIWVPRFLALSS